MSAPQVAALQAASNPKNLAIVVGGALILVGGVYFFVYRPVMQKFGLIPDRQAIRKLNQIKDYKGFSPTYARPSKVTISDARALELAILSSVDIIQKNQNKGLIEDKIKEALSQSKKFSSLKD
jgi:hypothetical protein